MLNVSLKDKSENYIYYYIAFLIYLIFNIILLLRHEPWRDEAQAWLLARDVKDFAALFRMMGYEGHPFLWHLLLWFPARLGLPFFTVKIINLMIIAGAVAIFLFRAPFKLSYKLPVVFGYYFFFEYGIVARSYSLGALLLLVVAALYPDRFKRPLVFALVIVLLAHVSIFFLFISGLLLLLYLLELKKAKLLLNKRNLAAAGLICVGLVFVFIQLLPPADLSPFLKKWTVSTNYKKYLNSFYFLGISTFFQVPLLEVRFWNNQLLYNETFKFAGLLILGSTFILLPKRVPFLLYSFSVSFILIIHLFKYPCTLHHFGQLYFMYLFCLWISRYYKKDIKWLADINHSIRQMTFQVHGYNFVILNLIILGALGLHIFSSAVAFYFDYNYEFSPGPGIARYLQEKGYLRDDILIAFQPSSVAASILPYLDRKQKFYYLEYQDFGTYMTWNATYEKARYLDPYGLLLRVYNGLEKNYYHKLLLILDRDVNLNIKVDKRILFVNVIVYSERLRLYDINLGPDGYPILEDDETGCERGTPPVIKLQAGQKNVFFRMPASSQPIVEGKQGCQHAQ